MDTSTNTNTSTSTEQHPVDAQEQEKRDKIQQYLESLKFPFEYKWDLEYYEILLKGAAQNPVLPLVIIRVDKMLSTEERSLVPSHCGDIKITMEYVMTLDPNDADVQKEMKEMQDAENEGDEDSDESDDGDDISMKQD
ncbi:hypothetical protein CYY_003865 [Polysphondylium violaceum]|uniref:Uncharacterized protein n=1 Tax=Polysphondylium violaceum TaxID=133409 RepID=A0A8J4PXU7_9MYCE|nr:hypothetical protein CYY_003865 [Polysphondylium violaceum]